MRDRFLALIGERGAAAPAVAAIAHEEAADGPRLDLAGHDRQIAARDGVLAKLHAEPAFRFDGAREDDQAARLLVEPLYDAQARAWLMFLLGQRHADLPHDEIVERRREQSAVLEPIALLRMAHGADTGRFFDDDQMRIDVANGNLIDDFRRPLGACEDFEDVACLEPTCFVEPDFAVDLDAMSVDELANLRPALSRQPQPQQGRQRFAGVLSSDSVRLLAHFEVIRIYTRHAAIL